jgi:outer membrane protein assembly factor BamB
MNAFRLGGKGDMTGKSLAWRYSKSLPNATSPLLYRDVIYMAKEGGILTSLNAGTGELYKQARLSGAPGPYYASPVAADGKVYTVSEEGKVSVIQAGPQWEILAVNTLDDEVHATPAIADGRLYLRTHSALYCFGTK